MRHNDMVDAFRYAVEAKRLQIKRENKWYQRLWKWVKNKQLIIIDFWKKITGKYDFTMRCLWRDQLRYEMFKQDGKEYAYVPMVSGRLAVYEVTNERVDYSADDTEQRNWHFKFIKIVAFY